MNCYCLFCRTQETERIAEELRRCRNVRAFSPQIVQRKWVRGQEIEERHRYLPGYVFVYAEEGDRPGLWTDGVIRILNEGEPLEGSDLDFALGLLRTEGVIGHVKVHQVGDRLTVAGGLLNGLEGEILKVDRHRTRLLLRFSFDNTERDVWLGYDVVE